MAGSWEDGLTPAERQQWASFVDHTRRDTLHKIAESVFVMSWLPDGEPDIKFAVELGLALMLDKPVIVLATGGRPVPASLRRVAHAVLEVDEIDAEAGRLELEREVAPVIEEFNRRT